jgi:putative CocE/NonD family hydrolase
MPEAPVTSVFQSADQPPGTYDRAPEYPEFVSERDVYVAMRDGVRLCVDIYRPKTDGKVPVLLAFAVYNKDMMAPEIAQALPPQPAFAPLWTGYLESGDTRFLTSRGYAHVVASPRNFAKSESGGSREWDSYDLIEWLAQQDWCDGNVGMVGISGFGAEQFNAAKQQPPHLKAIFPFDPRGAFGKLGSFREEYPGGVLHVFRYLISLNVILHEIKGPPKQLPPEREALWREAMGNADYKMYPHIYNVVTMKGQHLPMVFDLLINPYDNEDMVRKAEADFASVKVPAYTGSGWYGYTYKTHLNGAQSWFANVSSPKKMLLGGPAHVERPFHTLHHEMLRWFDHWLKGIDTGMMREAPVRYWVMGENRWREAANWPLPETQWTKFYLTSWGRLRPEPVAPRSAYAEQEPDTFVQMPLKQTAQVQKLRYVSEPLSQDVLVAGPISVTLFAAIDREDTNWFVALSDIGPDHGVRTAREGEREISSSLPEREITRGWLKASMHALDETRSKPGKPWHKLTREAREEVVPGEINEYVIEVMASANMFKAGHRICVDIMAMDVPTGVGGAANVEYAPYHICSSETVVHRVYHDADRPSHVLLPVIPS